VLDFRVEEEDLEEVVVDLFVVFAVEVGRDLLMSFIFN
jgi:hypothetical protein